MDLEILELDFGVRHFLDHFSILLGSIAGLVLRFGSCDDHFTRGEDKGRGFGLTDTNDDCGKTLWVVF